MIDRLAKSDSRVKRLCEVHVCWELLFIWLAELTALLDVSLCV